jgi:hypothetical protein
MRDALKMRIGPSGDELGVGRERDRKGRCVGYVARDCMGEMTNLALWRIGAAAMPVGEDYERERQHRDGHKDRYKPLRCGSAGQERSGVLRAWELRPTAQTRDVGNKSPAVYGQRSHQRQSLQDRSGTGRGSLSGCRMILPSPLLV